PASARDVFNCCPLSLFLTSWRRAEIEMRVRFLLPAHFYPVPLYSCVAVWLRFRSQPRFLPITWPPFTTGRVLPSSGSYTLTSAGSIARNPQKLATPLYLNAASRTAFAVSGWRAVSARESRF